MKERTGIVILIVLYAVGLSALLVNELRPVVLPLSPFTLLLSYLILMSSFRWKSPFVWVSLSVFVLGYVAEWVGVHKGWLFGTYTYGVNLGPKISGVPFIIGINWVMVTLVCGATAVSIFKKSWWGVLVAALLMVGLDYFMEPVAMENNYWSWDKGIIPLFNFVSWFIVALIAQVIYRGIAQAKANNTSWTLFVLLFVFFVVQFIF